MERFKYPRTYHLPFSHPKNDDKIITNLMFLRESDVIVTEKMDGENTSIYSDGYVHARSIVNDLHPSRTWVKKFSSEISYRLPAGTRICGENMFAKHSIFYDNLESYFLGFSLWKDDYCLSWEDTMKVFSELDIKTPKVLYEGKFDLKHLEELSKQIDEGKSEGFVVRNKCGVYLPFFPCFFAKYVRKNHVQSDAHWKTNWEQNKLK